MCQIIKLLIFEMLATKSDNSPFSLLIHLFPHPSCPEHQSLNILFLPFIFLANIQTECQLYDLPSVEGQVQRSCSLSFILDYIP